MKSFQNDIQTYFYFLSLGHVPPTNEVWCIMSERFNDIKS